MLRAPQLRVVEEGASVPGDPAPRRKAYPAKRSNSATLGNEVGEEVSIKPDVLSGLDPKPGELPMARLKPR